MSNGTCVWTPEDKAVVFDQFSKGMELVRENQRERQVVSSCLQAIISTDLVVSVLPKIQTTPDGKIFHVMGDWKTAAEAFDAGNYVHRWGLASEPAKIPMEVRPVDQRIRPVPLGKLTRAEDIVRAYPRMVSPISALAFGARCPKEQEETPHITLWADALGQLWCVNLNVSIGDRGRGVSVRRVDPDRRFHGGCRVLLGE